ncbi:MAG TPA: hypothetical protein VKI65_20525 [Gemmataceae bacterium]|nr:hypothetical protein [Gemmataceae bacterium]
MSILSTETKSWQHRALVPALLGLVVVVGLVSFGFVIWQWRLEEAARGHADRAQKDLDDARKKAKDDERQLRDRITGLDAERRKNADEADSARAQVRELQQQLEKATQETAAQKRKYEHTVAGMALDNGLKLCEAGDPQRGLLWLARALEMAPQDATDLRGATLRNLGCWHRDAPKPQKTIGQADTIGVVAFSADGKFLLAAGKDNSAQVYQVETGNPIGAPLKHRGPITAALFTPDSKLVVTAGEDDTVRTWDANTGKPAAEPMPHSNAVTALALSKDGKLVISASGKSAAVWELLTNKVIVKELDHEGPVTAVALSPDGKMALVGVGGEERGARLWTWPENTRKSVRLDHYDEVTAVAFSPDGAKILTASFDKTAQLWDTYPLRRIGKQPLPHEEKVSVIAFSPDDKTAATGSWDKTARLWNAETGLPLCPPLRHDGRLTAITFSPDGQLVLTASVDKTARLWDAATGRAIGRPLMHDDAVMTAAFSPDGKQLATGGRDKRVRIWDVPQPVVPKLDKNTAKRLLLWVQTTTKKELDATGVVHPLDAEEVQARTKELATLGGPPKM